MMAVPADRLARKLQAFDQFAGGDRRGVMLGLGERQVAVPWKDVALNADSTQVTIDMTKEQLEQAQRYDPDVPAAAGIDSEIKPLR